MSAVEKHNLSCKKGYQCFVIEVVFSEYKLANFANLPFLVTNQCLMAQEKKNMFLSCLLISNYYKPKLQLFNMFLIIISKICMVQSFCKNNLSGILFTISLLHLLSTITQPPNNEQQADLHYWIEYYLLLSTGNIINDRLISIQS